MEIPYVLILYCFAFLSAWLLLPSAGHMYTQEYEQDREQEYEQDYNDKRSELMVDCDKTHRCICGWSSASRNLYMIQCGEENLITMGNTEYKHKFDINCYGASEFDISFFPGLNGTDITEINIQKCPLAKQSYGDLVAKLNMSEIERFQMDYMNLKRSMNKTLTQTHFMGLERAQTVFVRSNQFLEIDEDAFAPLQNATLLNLYNNTLKLKPKMFSNNSNTRILDLSSSEIDVIPENIFANLSSLYWLALSNNRVKKIDEFTFTGLNNLQQLDLDRNEIEVISEKAFEPLVNLLELSLVKNKLTVLPQNVFGKIPKLQELRLDVNPNLVLSDYAFANVSSLKLLGLTMCNLTELSEHVFDGMPSLYTLELSKNQISELPEKVFHGLTMLGQLLLDENMMEAVPDLSNLKNLIQLNMIENMIENIGEDAFKGLDNLQELLLSRNSFEMMHPNALLPMPHLVKFVSNENNLQAFDCELFKSNVNLESIQLRYNRLTEFPKGCFYNKPKLSKLDLTGNSLSALRFIDLNSIVSSVQIDLSGNNISFIDFKDVDFSSGVNFFTEEKEKVVKKEEKEETEEQKVSVINLRENPIECDCHAYQLNQYLDRKIPNELRQRIKIEHAACGGPTKLNGRWLPAPPKLFVCPYGKIDRDFKCPNECNRCVYHPHTNSVTFNCTNRNLKDYPNIIHPTTKIYNSTTFHFENNSLEKGPEPTWSGWYGIEELYLDNNRIEEIPWVQNSLKTLSLENNLLRRMPDKVLKQIENSTITTLNLKNNPWSCECGAISFANFILRHHNMTNRHPIYCSGEANVKLVDMDVSQVCDSYLPIIVTSSVLIILMLLIIIVVLSVGCKRCFQKSWCLGCFHHIKNHKEYHVFLGYSQKDYDHADKKRPSVKKLLTYLWGIQKPYKIYNPSKDGAGDEMSADQIRRAVNKSKTTIVVLTDNFLTSVWSREEFRAAFDKAFQKGRNRLIVIVFGHINKDQLDAEFQSYVDTTSYIEWTQDNYAFWNKLKESLKEHETEQTALPASS